MRISDWSSDVCSSDLVTILDVGCGFGEALGYHRARGCDAHGIEADRNILRVAQRHGLNVTAGLFEAACYAPQKFDIVTLDQVIEPASDQADLLRNVTKGLKPGGQAIVSTPNPHGLREKQFCLRWPCWHAPHQLNDFPSLSKTEFAT